MTTELTAALAALGSAAETELAAAASGEASRSGSRNAMVIPSAR